MSPIRLSIRLLVAVIRRAHEKANSGFGFFAFSLFGVGGGVKHHPEKPNRTGFPRGIRLFAFCKAPDAQETIELLHQLALDDQHRQAAG